MWSDLMSNIIFTRDVMRMSLLAIHVVVVTETSSLQLHTTLLRCEINPGIETTVHFGERGHTCSYI